MSEQKTLFGNEQPSSSQTKQCERCAKRCRVVEKVDPNANLFVKGTMKTGRFCADCLVVDFFKNCDQGPSSALGKEYFDHSIPMPEWRKDYGDKDRRFDPQCLHEPHLRKQFGAILSCAQREYGAELTMDDIDWYEVVANWHLPFPETKKRGRRKQ